MGNAHTHQSIRIGHRWFIGVETEFKPGRRLTDAELMEFCADIWLANGVRLAWLLDPKMQKAYIYRPGRPVEELDGFERSLSGEDVCPGFEFDLRKLV